MPGTPARSPERVVSRNAACPCRRTGPPNPAADLPAQTRTARIPTGCSSKCAGADAAQAFERAERTPARLRAIRIRTQARTRRPFRTRTRSPDRKVVGWPRPARAPLLRNRGLRAIRGGVRLELDSPARRWSAPGGSQATFASLYLRSALRRGPAITALVRLLEAFRVRGSGERCSGC